VGGLSTIARISHESRFELAADYADFNPLNPRLIAVSGEKEMDTKWLDLIVKSHGVIPCPDLNRIMSFFADELKFREDAILGADNPIAAVMSGHGVRVCLSQVPAEKLKGDGAWFDVVDGQVRPALPDLRSSTSVTQFCDDETEWHPGRVAEMFYRDLIRDRQGGRFIASQIRVVKGGEVSDAVHFHCVRLQIIYCYKGWVRVVYEDQGLPVVMHAGDCVLQPPEIRHRVLECSDAMEVIEIACPAVHWTFYDHEPSLDSNTVNQKRLFSGQQFVHHKASTTTWRQEEAHLAGFESRDLGIEKATRGIASANVVRPSGATESPRHTHNGELLFIFILKGKLTLKCDARDPDRLSAGDSFVVRPDQWYELKECSNDLEFLQVAVPRHLPK
jgi:quercetin dioxygenase-like cupin family protein